MSRLHAPLDPRVVEHMARQQRALQAFAPGAVDMRTGQPMRVPPIPPRGERPRGGRGATVVVGSVYSSSKDQNDCDIRCDGEADDVQIQAACDYCEDIGGGRVLLASPYFSLAGTVTVPDWVIVEGGGLGDTVWMEVEDGVTAFSLEGDSSGLRNLSLRGLGTTELGIYFTPATGSSGIAVVGTRLDLLLDHVWIEKFATAIDFSDVLDGFLIEHCHITDVDVGIDASKATADRGRILHNRIVDAETAIIALGFETRVAHNQLTDHDIGIRCGGSLTNVSYNELDAGVGVGTGISVESNGFLTSQVRVSFNDVYDVEGKAIAVDQGNTIVIGNNVQNHTLGGSGDHCIYIDAAECTVSNNYVDEWADDPAATWDAIHLTANADRSEVTNNDADGTANNRSGVRVSAGCTNALVALNRIRGAAAVVSDAGTGTRLNFDGGAGNWNRAL